MCYLSADVTSLTSSFSHFFNKLGNKNGNVPSLSAHSLCVIFIFIKHHLLRVSTLHAYQNLVRYSEHNLTFLM